MSVFLTSRIALARCWITRVSAFDISDTESLSCEDICIPFFRLHNPCLVPQVRRTTLITANSIPSGIYPAYSLIMDHKS